LRERYPLQTSGFGLGTERYICWLLGHDDVRDCQLLPRFNGERIVP
jgi:asparaginyl-tRNA synthetase